MNPFLRGTLSFLKDLVIIVGGALLLSLLIKTFLLRSFYIPSESMEETLLINDRIIVNELVPDVMPVERGDVVVFSDPGGWLANKPEPEVDWFTGLIDGIANFVGFGGSDSNDHLVKRVIGLPGDHVMCCTAEGKLEVNGRAIEEPYIVSDRSMVASDKKFDVTVPENSLWVMGDNRFNSADSRYNMDKPGGGFVPYENLVGRAIVISWPVDRWTWLDNYSANFPNDK